MLIFVKNEEVLEQTISKLKGDNIDTETLSYTKEALKRGEVYYSCMSMINFEEKNINLISVKDREESIHKIDELHEVAKATLLKQIGSAEAQKDIIRKTLDLFISEYKGRFVNNPKAMKYGLRKDYLLELQKNGFPVIETKIYDKGTTKEEMLADISDDRKYIIKPLTGELSNSLSFLNDIDDEWLRRKEWIVEGWVIQPFLEDIWNGEIQLRYIGDENIFTLRKICENSIENRELPNQNDRKWEKINTSEEMQSIARSLRRFFEDDMKLGFIPYCRVDLIPTRDGIKILEFEMVNPGMGYFLFF